MPYLVSAHDSKLVILSIFIAILASYTALNLAGRAAATEGRTAKIWLFGCAFSMGIGIWSMHFIGMLAFNLPIRISYDVPITLLSLLIAMAVSGYALFLVSQRRNDVMMLCTAGTIMGLGCV